MEEIFWESNGHIEKGEYFTEYYKSLHDQDCLKGEQEKIVNSVLAEFRDMPVRELEILATTFFIDRQQKALFGSANQQYVLDKVRKVQTATFRGQQGRISRPVKAILSGRL